MDPVANITEQRELAAEILAHPYRCVVDSAARLAELVQALDEWRLSGGFDPYAPSITRCTCLDVPSGDPAVGDGLGEGVMNHVPS